MTKDNTIMKILNREINDKQSKWQNKIISIMNFCLLFELICGLIFIDSWNSFFNWFIYFLMV